MAAWPSAARSPRPRWPSSSWVACCSCRSARGGTRAPRSPSPPPESRPGIGARRRMTPSLPPPESPLVRFTLARADDALILGHRLSEWCGYGPTPEEDIALSNLGLDLLGQAR